MFDARIEGPPPSRGTQPDEREDDTETEAQPHEYLDSRQVPLGRADLEQAGAHFSPESVVNIDVAPDRFLSVHRLDEA